MSRVLPLRPMDARASGEVGVCLATSGPGATNLVTGHRQCLPRLRSDGGHHRKCPQIRLGRDAFQEVDFLGITMPIVKHSFLVLHPEDIAQAVHDAFHIAQSGRPGPVVIDIPKDVLLAEVQTIHTAHTPKQNHVTLLRNCSNRPKKCLSTPVRPWSMVAAESEFAGCVDTFATLWRHFSSHRADPKRTWCTPH